MARLFGDTEQFLTQLFSKPALILMQNQGVFVHAMFISLENGYFDGLAVTRLSILHFHFYSLFLDRPDDKCYNKIISNFTCIS